MSSAKSFAPGPTLADAVRPQDCAFLVTVPTTREEFLEDLENPGKDFIRGRFAGSALRPANKWTLYESTAAFLGELLNELQRLGVSVVRRATLSDWRRAQARSSVVVLFAHWRSARLRVTDVDWDKLMAAPRLTAPEQQPISTVMDEARATADRSATVRRLNDVLSSEALGFHPWLGTKPNTIPASVEHRVYINRRFLDSMLPGTFSGGARVEFGDTLADVEEVAQACAPRFEGIIDLSVCTSTLLSEMIKARAPGCLVVATALPAMLDFRVAFYGAVFKRLRGGRPYVATLTELRRQMIALAGDLQQ